MKKIRYKRALSDGMRVSVGRLDGCLDLVVSWLNVGKADVSLMHYSIAKGHYGYNKTKPNKSLIVELIERKYDITTLDVKINKIDESDLDAVAINEFLLQHFKEKI